MADDYKAERERTPQPVELVISTRVPSKWLLVDRETGDQWEWREGAWRRPRGRVTGAEGPWNTHDDLTNAQQQELLRPHREHRAQGVSFSTSCPFCGHAPVERGRNN